ncbi:MAG: sigma-70 family RNA polymerase sigma factor [Nocardioides sp.]
MSSRTPSSRSIASGLDCETPNGRCRTCVGRWSTAPRRDCAIVRWSTDTRPASRVCLSRWRSSSEADTLDKERRTAVLTALAALPRRQREVLALRYYLDLSEAEIADTLGISRGAVKSHASRGVAALRPLLEGYLKDLP